MTFSLKLKRVYKFNSTSAYPLALFVTKTKRLILFNKIPTSKLTFLYEINIYAVSMLTSEPLTRYP
jgi:hypothetical protein